MNNAINKFGQGSINFGSSFGTFKCIRCRISGRSLFILSTGSWGCQISKMWDQWQNLHKWRFLNVCRQWCANPNPDLIWIQFKYNLCLIDSDLDLTYFEKGGFDLDLDLECLRFHQAWKGSILISIPIPESELSHLWCIPLLPGLMVSEVWFLNNCLQFFFCKTKGKCFYYWYVSEAGLRLSCFF